MVDRLIAAGHEVRVLGRSPRAREALQAAGAVPVGRAAAVAAGADVVCVCVFSDDQVKEICLGEGSSEGAPSTGAPSRGALPAAMPEGSVLVLHTTGSPRTAQAIAASDIARARNIGVLDAPVSGGPHDIAAGHLTLLVGGDQARLDRAKPVLDAYGDPVLHLGPVGSGQAVKLVNNALFAANIGLVAAAVGLGDRLGIDERTLLSALQHGSSSSRALAGVAARGSAAGFATAIAEFLGKDVAVVRTVAAEFGTDLGVLSDAIAALPPAP
jgi:3-hydroxyisobutyrate dehydrogenase-like beta-hydroxyacid dehydrogenase